jgi:hypothetical protein
VIKITGFDAGRVYIPVIPALRKLSQEDFKFKASLGYLLKPCLKKKQNKKKPGFGVLISLDLKSCFSTYY